MAPDPSAHRPRPPRWAAAAWLQATPAELLGLTLLLAGGLAVAGVLWWQSGQRPTELPAAAPEHGTALDVSGAGEAVDAVEAHGEDAAHLREGHAADGAEGAGVGEVGSSGEVVVHVTGAVARPGLVTLPAGSRVGDAVDAAGGAVGDTDMTRVNLARPLQDGEHVHLLRVGEEPPHPADGGGSASSEDPASSSTGGITADGKVDLNRATADELETLPGIGPAKAAAIVNHREEHGPFRVAGDLRAVPGIGEKTFQNLADHVVVS
jgi:competence protein ComEA